MGGRRDPRSTRRQEGREPLKRSDLENPLDDKSTMAVFARSKGWQVVIDIVANDHPYKIIPPLGYREHNAGRVWRYQTASGAWTVAAGRAGFQAPPREPIQTRPTLPPRAKAGPRSTSAGR